MEGEHSLSVAVVEAVADRIGKKPTELSEPLNAVIDPDALDRLFKGTSGRITFRYYGCDVTVDHRETVEVIPINSSVL